MFLFIYQVIFFSRKLTTTGIDTVNQALSRAHRHNWKLDSEKTGKVRVEVTSKYSANQVGDDIYFI